MVYCMKSCFFGRCGPGTRKAVQYFRGPRVHATRRRGSASGETQTEATIGVHPCRAAVICVYSFTILVDITTYNLYQREYSTVLNNHAGCSHMHLVCT